MSSANPDTRERILIAARTLLEGGKGATVRMSDIAKKAGVSRQALYLHFATRAELLTAVTYYVDELFDTDARLAPSRAATTGTDRLDAFVSAWAAYIPKIYPTGRALMAMSDTDEEADAAWKLRMEDMREGCEAAIKALADDGTLSADYSAKEATDIMWTLLSVRNWEQLTQTCGWSQRRYAKVILETARRLFVEA
jgi:AcrR family transcriptional regulator